MSITPVREHLMISIAEPPTFMPTRCEHNLCLFICCLARPLPGIKGGRQLQ